MREICMSSSMRGRWKRAATYRACVLLYGGFAPPRSGMALTPELGWKDQQDRDRKPSKDGA